MVTLPKLAARLRWAMGMAPVPMMPPAPGMLLTTLPEFQTSLAVAQKEPMKPPTPLEELSTVGRSAVTSPVLWQKVTVPPVILPAKPPVDWAPLTTEPVL